MAYVFVTGGVKVTALITKEYYMNQILRWIEFITEDQRDIIYDDSINSFGDIKMFKEKYISDLSTDFSGRTWYNGETHFGMRRTKIMKALLHWVQDVFRI